MSVRIQLLFLSALTIATATGLAGPVADLSGPVGGWRSATLDDEQKPVAAYPKPPVDRGAQRARLLIEGRLRAASRARLPSDAPARLIVNGNAMPLYADPDGRFARPWAFGKGSNSIELVSPDGATRQRVQFYEAAQNKVSAKLRTVLTWDDPKAEVDLHVVSPSGAHAFWAEPLLGEGSGLDVDSVDGAGPEIFSSAAPQHGTWLFYVNYWGNFDATDYNFDDSAHVQKNLLITARLALVFDENTPNERRETLVVPLRKLGEPALMKAVRL